MKARLLIFYFAISAAFFLPPTERAEAAASGENSTPAQVFAGMRESFRADKAKGVQARYQFKFSGPDGGNWWIIVRDGTFTMNTGTIDKPDVTFASSDKDWVRLSNGTLGGTWAFLSGRLKISGSQSVAKKLNQIFP